jgi:hypothetical protein
MDVVFFFSPFCRSAVCNISHKLILSCNALAFHTICLHSYFLLSRTGMGGRVSFYFLFVYMWSSHVFIARALCGTECRADAFVLQQSLPKYLEQWPAALTIWLILRDPRSRELNPLQSLYQLYSLSVLNKLQYSWRGNYCKCVRPAQLPVLTQVRAPSLLEQYLRYVPHRDRAGYDNAPLLS